MLHNQVKGLILISLLRLMPLEMCIFLYGFLAVEVGGKDLFNALTKTSK
jgi:hypothetical protein